MQAKLLEWVVKYLLSNVNKETAADALVGILRGAASAVKSVAAKTETTVDDAVAAKVGEVVEELADMLKVA